LNRGADVIGQWSAFRKKAREHKNATSFLGKSPAKTVMASVQVSLREFVNPANSSPLQVLGNLGGHPQLVSGRTPRILLSAQPVDITIHQRAQNRQRCVPLEPLGKNLGNHLRLL